MSATKSHATRRRASDRRRFLKQAVGVGATLAAAGVGGGVGRAQASNQYVRFDHVSFPMRNTGAMLAFYRDLGFQVNEGDRICSVHFGRRQDQPAPARDLGKRRVHAAGPAGGAAVRRTSASSGAGSATELERTFERVGRRGHRDGDPARAAATAASTPGRAATSGIRTETCSSSSSTREAGAPPVPVKRGAAGRVPVKRGGARRAVAVLEPPRVGRRGSPPPRGRRYPGGATGPTPALSGRARTGPRRRRRVPLRRSRTLRG